MLYIFNIDEQLQAVLKNDGKSCPYYDPYHTEELNENFQNVFVFTVPADHADAQYVTEGNLVAFKDLDQDWQLFEIKRITDLHGDGLTRTAYCEHALYELIDDFIEDVRPTACSATFALTQALTGTRWSVGTVADLGLNSTNYYYQSALSSVQKVASVWSGELQFRVVVTGGVISARYVDLLIRRGADTGKQWEYGRHTQEIEREVDLTTVITAAYGRGKGVEVGDGYGRRLDFGAIVWTTPTNPADKPLNQEWVGDPDALAQWGRPGGRHRFGTFEDSEETDAAALLQKTWDYLQAYKTPRATYRMTVMDLERLSGYEHEKVRLGDTTRGIDRIIKPALLVSVRVIGLTRNLLQPEDTKITLGNFAPSLSDEALSQGEINQTTRDRQGVWDRATQFNQDGTLNTAWLTGVINVLTNQLQSTTSNWYTDANGNMIFETLDGTAAMMLTGNGFMLSNEKDLVTGAWIWRTFGTGAGFSADELNAGQIQTSLIKIFGNTNFYWDSDYIYIINPSNLNQQIRLSKEGIRFTKDGGTTWGVAIGFDGILMEGKPSDPRIWYAPDGQRTYNQSGELVAHQGYFEILAAQLAAFIRASTSYDSYGNLIASGVPRYEYMHQPAPVWQDTFDTDQLSSQYTSGGDTPATWAVSGGVLTGTGGAYGVLIKNDLLLRDCEIEVNCDQANIGGIVARYRDDKNYYLLELFDDSGAVPTENLRLVKRVSGMATYFSPKADVTWPRGSVKTIKLTLHGSIIDAYFDGVKVLSFMDTTFSGGGVGLMNRSSTPVRFLDFKVYNATQAVMVEESCTNIVSFWPAGWTASGLIATDQGVQSGAALNTVRLTNDGATYGSYISPLFALSPSTKYTFKFKARGTVGIDKFNYFVLSNTGTLVQCAVYNDEVTGVFSGKELTFTTTADITGTNQYIRFDHNGNDAGYNEIAEVELIQKPIALSFPGYGATRATEALTNPTANILNVAEGEISIDVYIDPNGVHSASNPNYNMAFAVVTIQASPYQEQNQISFRRNPSTTQWVVFFANSSGVAASVSLGNITMPGVYRITASWKSGIGGYGYLNGVLKGSVASTYLPSAFATTMVIGAWDSTGSLPIDSSIMNFRVLNKMRTDADVLADYATGLPLSVTEYTTCLMSCAGNLQPTIRDFGGYLKNGRIIIQDPQTGQGFEVWDGTTRMINIGRLDDGTVGGEFTGCGVYASTVQTGAKGATTYIALTPDGTLAAYYAGKRNIGMWANQNWGNMIYYYDGVEVGQLYTASETDNVIGGTQNRFHVWSKSGGSLCLSGPGIELQSDNVFLAGSSTAQLWARGKFRDSLRPAADNSGYVGDSSYRWNTGYFYYLRCTDLLTTGPKTAVEVTENFGVRRLAARESPETRYIDEGDGELINGECRIDIDPIFLECIEPNTDSSKWRIQLTAYCDANIKVAGIYDNYFIVQEKNGGTSSGSFTWTLSAVRKGWAGKRLEEMSPEESEQIIGTIKSSE